MTYEELKAEFKTSSGAYPREALIKATENREAVTPGLLQIIKKTLETDCSVIEQDDYRLCIYAMYLLAQFREKKAYPLIVRFFSMPDERALEIVAFMFIEDLGRILASVSCGDTTLLKELIENRQAQELIRSSAIEALLILVYIGEVSRVEVIDYFRELYKIRLEKRRSMIWVSLITCSVDLYPGDLYEEIDQIFEKDLVDESFISQERVYDALEMGREQVLSRFFEGEYYKLIEDAVKEMDILMAEPIDLPASADGV
jgi:hypothetical protein